MEVGEKTAYYDEGGEYVAYACDYSAEAVELLVKRRFHAVVDLRSYEHFSVLRCVAHLRYPAETVTVDHGCPAQDVIRRVGGFFVEVLRPDGLLHYRLAREGRFVHLQRYGFEQVAVGGHFVARVEHHKVVYDDVAARHFGRMAVPDDLDGLVVVHLVEHVERLVSFDFEPKADTRGQHYGNEDACWFEKGFCSFVSVGIFENGDAHGGQQGYQQDADDGVLELFEELLPQGLALGRCEHVGAVLGAAGFDLFVVEAAQMSFVAHGVILLGLIGCACRGRGIPVLADVFGRAVFAVQI